MSSLDERQQKAVLDKAAQLNIPVRIEGPGHKVSLLYDFLGDEPVYRTTLNINAAISTGANLLNQAPYGLDGTGVTVGLWDESRARTNHVELAGKVTIMDGVSANSDHSTHCAGTIAGKGVDVKAKGMGIATRINSFDWNSDYAEMTAYAAVTATQTNMLSISSHSYGVGLTNVASVYNPYLGVYEAEAANTDEVAYAAPYHLIFWAAGNEQDYYITRGGYQSITFNALAKNVITIGAADDAVTSGARNPAVGSIANFSSEGPCDDGRIKPDIVANGVNLYSCVASNTTSYDTYSGTSMATPNASGSAALLVQLYKSNFPGQIPKASTLKGLMIHTADDVGRPGPDYQYGWGYLNVKAAADVILAHKGGLAGAKMFDGSITSVNMIQTYSFVWDGSTPIRATLVWADPAGTAQATNNTHSHAANLVHDLDLKFTAPNRSTTYLPYVMPYVGTWTTNSMTNNAVTGTNKVDNVERIDIPAPTQLGTYTITVGMYGTNTLTQTNQAYSLIVTGGVSVDANPPPVVNITAPTDGSTVLSGSPIPINATATDLAVGGQPGQVAKVEFFDGLTLLAEDNSAPYQFSWTNATSGVHVITAKATDSEGATTVSSGVNVRVLVGDGKPTISSFSPAAGIAGDSVTINGNNLGVTSSIRFGSLAATFATNSASQITATVPTSAVTAPITISNSYGSVTSSSNFSILPIVFREDFASITNGNSTSTTGSPIGWSGNTNFPSTNLVKVYQAGGSVKLGSSSATGSMTSRAINLAGNGGAFTVSFKVKGWSAVGSIKVTAVDQSQTVGQSQTVNYAATMSNVFETKTLNFTGGTSATTIKIETTSQRAFVDDVLVTATVPTSPPVITSPLSAAGTVAQDFSYQIIASNSPTSFGATNLPSWASINTTTGLISGANPTAGTSVVGISASNSVGLVSTNLTISILSSGGGGTTISATGTLSSVNTLYGTASTNPTSFTVSGANLAEGIKIAPPAGFEVSANSTNGFAGKGNWIVVGSVGTVPNTSIFVRLAADADVGTYSGNIVCSSFGVSNATIMAVASTVSAKPISVIADSIQKSYGESDPELTYTTSESAPFSGALIRAPGENVGVYALSQGDLTAGPNYTISFAGRNFEIKRTKLNITATDITKSFGQALTLGAGQTGFTTSGLKNNETVGSITLTASGGPGPLDRGGPYDLVPTSASGGTFSSQNYDISYNSGLLSVVPPTFDEWMSIAYPQLNNADRAPGADPDEDGISNLMEYFVGSDPTLPAGSSSSLVKITNGPSNTFSMTYQRAKGVTNVSSAVQATVDLSSSSSWGTNGVKETVADKDSSYEEVTATVTNAPGATKMFMRLKVSQP